MSDDEIVRACAETVMGWKVSNCVTSQKGEYQHRADAWCHNKDGQFDWKFAAPLDWDPLTFEDNNAQVLDKMCPAVPNAFCGVVHASSQLREVDGILFWECQFPQGGHRVLLSDCNGDVGACRRRAIVLAALWARVVEVEEGMHDRASLQEVQRAGTDGAVSVPRLQRPGRAPL